MGAVHAIVAASASERGLPPDETNAFFERLQRNAATAGGLDELLNPTQLMHIAVRLWTSAEQLGRREQLPLRGHV